MKKVSHGEAPPGGSIPSPFTYQLFLNGTSLTYTSFLSPKDKSNTEDYPIRDQINTVKHWQENYTICTDSLFLRQQAQSFRIFACNFCPVFATFLILRYNCYPFSSQPIFATLSNAKTSLKFGCPFVYCESNRGIPFGRRVPV